MAVTHAGDGRLYVTELRGKVKIVEDGEVLAEPFLDVTDRVPAAAHGLLSIAFHPDYASNGYVFAHRAEKGSRDLLIVRYQVTDPDRIDPATEVVLIRVEKERTQHYGGQLQFGPDGYLYAAIGDDSGGGLFDPECASQSLERLEGKILRLDVDRRVNREPYYAIPRDNPFRGTGRPAIWARGLRNPWRFSFDRETGDLWIGDVGEFDLEEVNFQPAGSPGGHNYGWKVMEGTSCFADTSGCGAPLPGAPLADCHEVSLTAPVIEYAHASDLCAVIGGYVYRGRAIPDLAGHYLYVDICRGVVTAARYTAGVWQPRELGSALTSISSFGEDAGGEIYLTALDGLFRLVDPTVTVEEPTCVADATHLCLNQGRFRVSVDWRTDSGQTGSGQAVPGGEDAGSFWFFSSNNPEIFVKVLDACGPFNRFWVFAAGLTEVETSLEVVDTKTGEVRRYDRPLGVPYEAISDTAAFATCP